MNVAIIPARAGSKRIPKKNIKKFCGKPMIFYSIKNAIESKCFKKIIVSTDDEIIAKIDYALAHPEDMNKMTDTLYSRVHSEHNFDCAVENITNVIDEICLYNQNKKR